MTRQALQLSKSGFLHFLQCEKSFWLHERKPHLYPETEVSDYARKLIAEGYAVEGYVNQHLSSRPDGDRYDYQTVFETERGLYARADVVRRNADGTMDLFEIKSSTSAKDEHFVDLAFQALVAEEAGARVSRLFLVHLNGAYQRQGEIDPEALLTIVDVTGQVNALRATVGSQIDAALAVLALPAIDESSCACLWRTRSAHCEAFAYFNPDVPDPSVYDLPYIRGETLARFVDEGRLSLDEIGEDEVSERQALVLQSARASAPVIDHGEIAGFFAKVQYPVHFLDYETYSSAIPLIDGAQPQKHVPFQYSLHIKHAPDDPLLTHVEYLADAAISPLAMIKHMRDNISPRGSVVSWHASFENSKNREMARQFPEMAPFLKDLTARTLDLEDIFKTGYVSIAFRGSTSIKAVLPVLAQDLSYADLSIPNGTAAMEAWARLITMPEGVMRDQLRADMLEYCKRDTYAMVRIFEEMERHVI